MQNIRHGPRVSYRAGGGAFKGDARIVDPQKQPELAAKVAKLMGVKYGRDEGRAKRRPAFLWPVVDELFLLVLPGMQAAQCHRDLPSSHERRSRTASSWSS